ncbi:hypothetical protein Tco_0115637 [Tanacetum coccineum]
MADSWKSIDLDKLVINEDMIDYVLEKYGNNYDKGNGPLKGIKILDDLEQRIENVEKYLNKAKEKKDLNKAKEKMMMEKGNSSFERIA